MSFQQQQRDLKKNGVVAISAVNTGGALVPRLLGGSMAGVLELALFHPVDTCAKRLMSNKKPVFVGGLSGALANTNQIVFKEAANAGLGAKVKSLFPGIGYGAAYKICQRTYKYGGQPFVKDFINKNYGDKATATFGKNVGKVVSSGVAGAIMGVGEIALLPFDVLKIKAQTNPEALKGRGVVDIFMTEGRGLYRGAGWTAARNAPGSFALFGGSAVVFHGVFGLDTISQATVSQNFIASIAGSVASIVVAAPLDVVKTRIQNRPFDSPESGVTIVRNLVRNEGFGAFFKGTIPKVMVVGPKLIFSYTAAMSITNYFQKSMA